MKNNLDAVAAAVVSALLLSVANPVLAQDPKQTGQDRTVPAAPADRTPTAGESSPARQEDGTTNPGTLQGKSPLEVDTKALAKSESDFYSEAAISNVTELTASRLAATRAKDPKVRSFASKLVADHQKMATELRRMAAQKKLVLPTAPDTQRQTTLNALSKYKDEEFDKAYIQQMVHDHQDAVAFFERQEKESADTATKAFVASALPTLRMHAEQAKAFYGSGAGK